MTDDNWRNTEAARLLEKDLMEDNIPLDAEDMEPRVVYFQRPEFSDVDYEKFRRNLNEMRKRHRAMKSRANDDAEALAHDRRIYPKPAFNHRGEPRWEGSDAEKSLRLDVQAGKNRTMRPKALYESREEYKIVPLDVFRGHIDQEWRRQKYIRQLRDKAAGTIDPAYNNLDW
jgi:hypothetical protein